MRWWSDARHSAYTSLGIRHPGWVVVADVLRAIFRPWVIGLLALAVVTWVVFSRTELEPVEPWRWVPTTFAAGLVALAVMHHMHRPWARWPFPLSLIVAVGILAATWL